VSAGRVGFGALLTVEFGLSPVVAIEFGTDAVVMVEVGASPRAAVLLGEPVVAVQVRADPVVVVEIEQPVALVLLGLRTVTQVVGGPGPAVLVGQRPAAPVLVVAQPAALLVLEPQLRLPVLVGDHGVVGVDPHEADDRPGPRVGLVTAVPVEPVAAIPSEATFHRHTSTRRRLPTIRAPESTAAIAHKGTGPGR
jgi:hypothetical protein